MKNHQVFFILLFANSFKPYDFFFFCLFYYLQIHSNPTIYFFLFILYPYHSNSDDEEQRAWVVRNAAKYAVTSFEARLRIPDNLTAEDATDFEKKVETVWQELSDNLDEKENITEAFDEGYTMGLSDHTEVLQAKIDLARVRAVLHKVQASAADDVVKDFVVDFVADMLEVASTAVEAAESDPFFGYAARSITYNTVEAVTAADDVVNAADDVVNAADGAPPAGNNSRLHPGFAVEAEEALELSRDSVESAARSSIDAQYDSASGGVGVEPTAAGLTASAAAAVAFATSTMLSNKATTKAFYTVNASVAFNDTDVAKAAITLINASAKTSKLAARATWMAAEACKCSFQTQDPLEKRKIPL
jgi:hypothetical protein